MVLLEIKNLSVTYNSGENRVKSLRDVSFDINEGESIGIVGESGSGKTTLIMAILRLLTGNSATITGKAIFNDKDLISINENELSKLRWEEIALVFQKSMNAFSPVHRIGAFMSDIYRIHKPEVSKLDAKNRMEELFALVNLPDRVYEMYPHELSGGMMQRVGIALSLIFNPKLLILDEATTALDVITQTQILEEIAELEYRMGITKVIITHDISVVASSCRKVAVLYAGSLLEIGLVEEVLVKPFHPYTQGLTKSFPKFDNEANIPLQSIPGSLPDLSAIPSGCIFAPRCNRVMEICHHTLPIMKDFGRGHFAACHLARSENNE